MEFKSRIDANPERIYYKLGGTNALLTSIYSGEISSRQAAERLVPIIVAPFKYGIPRKVNGEEVQTHDAKTFLRRRGLEKRRIKTIGDLEHAIDLLVLGMSEERNLAGQDESGNHRSETYEDINS